MNGARYFLGTAAVGSWMAIAWALVPAEAAAQQPGMYRCKSPTGTWEFLDRPCPGESKLLAAPPPPKELRWPITVTPLSESEAKAQAAEARAAAAEARAAAAEAAAADAAYWGYWPYPRQPRRWR